MPSSIGYARDAEIGPYRSSEHRYSNVREILSPEYQDLSGEEIELLFQDMFGDSLTPEDVEGFFSNLGRGIAKAGRRLAPVAAQLAPVAGAALGTVVGGPAGTAIGGALGGVAGRALSGVGQQPRRRSGRPPGRSQMRSQGRSPGRSQRQSPRRTQRQRGRPQQQPRFRQAQASPAAARLSSVLSNPQVRQALMALLMGNAGRQSVRISGESVPVGAIASTIEVLAREAAEEHNALQPMSGEAASAYLLDEYGEFLVDPASQEERAALLYELLEEDMAGAESLQEEDSPVAHAQHRYLQEQIDGLYDQLEAAYDDEAYDDELYDEFELADGLELYDEDDL